MLLFKFKSLKTFAHIEQIISSDEFYLSNWREFNDPMEGHFTVLYEDRRQYQRLLQDFIHYKLKLRICSFSGSLKNILLWSHYADQHKGIAIGVRTNGPLQNDVLANNFIYSMYKVAYVPNIPQMELSPNATPITVLTKKISIWAYEKEYRYISEDSTAHIGPIDSIYFGIRTSQDDKDRIKELVANKPIKIYDTSIDFRKNHIVKKII